VSAGYLERLASRAAGAPAVAGPRLPALFEAAGDPTGFDVVEQTRPQPTRPQVPAARPADPDGPVARPDPARTAAPERPVPAIATAQVTAENPSLPVPAPVPTLPTTVVGPRLPTDPAPPPGTALTRPDLTGDRVLVVAVPAPPRPGPDPRAGDAASVAAHAGAPAPHQTSAPELIRVTIGRVDVRASVAMPPPAPERPARADRPSLHDYLRGGRR
jgi:hypothetical protein